MTREQIEELRRQYAMPGVSDAYWMQHIMPLLAAAERALQLEEVLAAAQFAIEDGSLVCIAERGGLRAHCSCCMLKDAIDRAEGSA